MSQWPWLILVGLVTLLLGCAQPPASSRECSFAHVVLVRPGDALTPETAAALLTLDRQIVAVCGRR